MRLSVALIAVCLQGQSVLTQSSTPVLPAESIPSAQGKNPATVLSDKASSSVVPKDITDRLYELGRYSKGTEIHDHEIKTLQDSVKAHQQFVDFGKGVFWAAGGVLGALALVLKFAWRPLSRYALKAVVEEILGAKLIGGQPWIGKQK